MEQRTLRLGDIVDDYCPRERRITNHTIVALVGENIRQTRCSTCDSEHVYKDGREPRRRKKDAGELDDKGVADAANSQLVPVRLAETDETLEAQAAADAVREAEDVAAVEVDDTAADGAPAEGTWFGHRQLIRATLPRTGTEPPAPRPIPEFTMHQRPQGRGGRGGFRGPQQSSWRGNGGGGNGDGPNGNVFRHGRPGEANGNGSNGHGGKPNRNRGRHNRPR